MMQSSFPLLSTTSIASSDEQHYFCYFDVKNQQTLLMVSCMLLLSLVICAIAVKKYRDIWKLIVNRNRKANIIYSGILVWWLTFFFKDSFAIVIYLIHNGKEEEVSISSQDLSWLSKLYFSIDWTNAFIIQTLIIFVPYHWMKQISEALSQVTGSGSVGVEQDPNSSAEFDGSMYSTNSAYEGIESGLYPKIKLYLKVQINQFFKQIRAFALAPIIAMLIVDNYQAVTILSKMYIYFTILVSLISILVVDCLIITVILTLGVYSLRTNQLLKMQLDEDQARKLLMRYGVIVICTLIRFIFDSYVLIYLLSSDQKKNYCRISENVKWDFFGFLLGTTIFIYYLPIIMILRIYTVEQKPEELTKSLIVAE